MPSINYAAHIGLDWADCKHDFCLKARESEVYEYGVLEHSPEAIQQWVLGLRKRFGNQTIAISLELKAGPVVYALLKYSFIVLFPIPPRALSKYREAFTQSGAKDDPTDAYLQLDYMLRHGHTLKQLIPDSPETRMLKQFTEDRRTLVSEKVRLSNRITAALKDYYPQVLQWFNDIDTQLFCKFVQRWPTLQSAKKARHSTLTNFFTSHNCVSSIVIKRRLSAIKSSMALTNDPGVIVPSQRFVLALTTQLSLLLENIHQYDLEIAKQFRCHSEYDIFSSLPGAGAVFGPRLLTAFGTQRNRFDSADEVARLSGIAPVLERSGKKQWVHWRYSCPKFLRQSFVEWAGLTPRYSFWAKAYYDKQRALGKSHQATIRALAFKWIRIIFRCWKDKKSYDEAKYLFALKKHNSDLLNV